MSGTSISSDFLELSGGGGLDQLMAWLHKLILSGSCVDGDQSYSCNCDRQYTGTFCETKLDPCHSNPCKNRALCILSSATQQGYQCYCKHSFSGNVRFLAYHYINSTEHE